MKDKYRAPGLPDELFIKNDSPMTRQEIRAITLSKANIGRGSIVYDIGAGTGSISIEAAMLADKGRVYSIERLSERTEIIERNIEKFGLSNIDVVQGEAPFALEKLPEADRIIIGGSGGRIEGILAVCNNKLKKDGVIVITAVTLDTPHKAVACLDDMGFKLDIIHVAITRVDAGGHKIMKAANPVFVIKGVR